MISRVVRGARERAGAPEREVKPDPRGSEREFAQLEGNTRRAIDFHEGDKIDEKALKALIRIAAALNTSMRAAAGPVRSQKRTKRA